MKIASQFVYYHNDPFYQCFGEIIGDYVRIYESQTCWDGKKKGAHIRMVVLIDIGGWK